ncbi:MFS transporter [Microlunatus speluncae]|uniref:MFS transporter n=1 Tax=Microlunatus speluncae TaxID=2594267 RepID=UPI0012667A1A|nr:MFS transporter [Microlunatus speluncae]
MNDLRLNHPRRWIALVPLLVVVFMDMVDSQIVAVALPSIRATTGASGSALEWIAAGYTLTFALLLITGGRLGDRYGRKSLLLVGIAGFTLTSLLAGLAPTVEVLIIARLAQGACAGLMVPQVLAYVQTEFPPEERGKAFGLYGITFPIGGLAGPLLGGLLTGADLFGLGWRPIFLVNLPVGVLAMIMIAALMPRRNASTAAVRVDAVGTLLAGAVVLSLLVPLIQGMPSGWPWWSVLLLIAFVPLLLIFLAHQRHRPRAGREPLLDLGLLRRPGFGPGLLVAWLFLAGMAVFFVLTLHLQEVLRFSPMITAVTFLPATLGIIAGNGLALSVGAKAGRGLVALGLLASFTGIAGIALTVFLAAESLQLWQLLPSAVIFGLGLGLTMGKLVAVALQEVPAESAGSASGVINTVFQLGSATGIALIGSVYFDRLHAGLPSATAVALALAAALALVLIALLATRHLPTPPPAAPNPHRAPVSATQ